MGICLPNALGRGGPGRALFPRYVGSDPVYLGDPQAGARGRLLVQPTRKSLDNPFRAPYTNKTVIPGAGEQLICGDSFQGIGISKHIEVVLPSGSSYYVSFLEAQRMVRANDAKWQGNKQITRHQDSSKRAIWEPRQ